MKPQLLARCDKKLEMLPLAASARQAWHAARGRVGAGSGVHVDRAAHKVHDPAKGGFRRRAPDVCVCLYGVGPADRAIATEAFVDDI